MVQKIRNFVFFLMRFKLIRFLSIPFIALGNILRKEKHRYNLLHRERLSKEIHSTYLKEELSVMAGPFKGLQYPAFKAYTSSILPKILGTYESEIYDHIDTFLKKKYAQVIDIGAAEGYYAVGIARNMNTTPIICYDVNPQALAFCKKMGELNQINNLQVNGLFTTEHFEKYAYQNSLIICDVDGYEKDLFPNTQIVEKLKFSDLIIETHDYIDPSITQNLIKVFSPTHDCVVIPYKSNKVDELPKALFEKATLEEKKIAVLERIVDNKWIIAKAKNTLSS